MRDMNIQVEKARYIFKHLVHVGAPFPVRDVMQHLLSKGYRYTIRKIKVGGPTPQTSPVPADFPHAKELTEYLFFRQDLPNLLIVVSENGFVVDGQEWGDVYDHIWFVRDLYLKIEKRPTTKFIIEILAFLQVYSSVSPRRILSGIVNPAILKRMQSLELLPFAIDLWTGEPEKSKTWARVRLEPLKEDPQNRFGVNINYRAHSFNEGVKFFEQINDFVSRLIVNLRPE